jgi:hypothetical protein
MLCGLALQHSHGNVSDAIEHLKSRASVNGVTGAFPFNILRRPQQPQGFRPNTQRGGVTAD